jgi:hypothetical protein
MMQALALRWRKWKQPSLMRRLLLAQMAVVALLWTMAIALLLYDSYEDPELLKYEKIFHAITTIAENLADRPDRPAGDAGRLRPGAARSRGRRRCRLRHGAPVMQVWQKDRLIYRSTAACPSSSTRCPTASRP